MIRLGAIGRIASGDQQGHYVRVEDDRERSGGYLVLTAADRAFTDDAGDAWVADDGMLQRFFDEANWVVEWEG